MRKKLLALLLITVSLSVHAQKKTYKIDIDMFNRSTSEVTEPEFLRWESRKDVFEDTFDAGDGVTFRIASEHNFRGGWNKAFVQSKEHNSRLTGDGYYLDPNECGSMTLYIKGLAPGNHTIQTYHNAWDDPARFIAWPITVSLDSEVVHKSVPQTLQVASMYDATVIETSFTVNNTEEEISITFSTFEEDAPDNPEGKAKTFRSPALNGFVIDGVSAVMQAKNPFPVHNDLHVDADDTSCVLTWEKASDEVKSHLIFIGTDSATVAEATLESPCFKATQSADETTFEAKELTNAHVYCWRVDEIYNDGTVVKGMVWKFRPRHLAFPGAEGYGRFAQGGRYGKVVYVTNLNSDGPGSYREAVKKGGGPRTILFMVSGIIDLGLKKEFTDDNITIAGQSAPGKGICLAHSDMGVGNDVICRFMRFRRGYHDDIHGNAMGVNGSNHTIADHLSTSWGTDETVSGRNAENVTFQYSMISEALGMGHGFAATIGGDVGSYHHNFLVNCSGRNWSMGGGLKDGYYAGRLDLFNNVCYNWWKRATDGGAHEVNFVGNYYKMGPDTNKKQIMVLQLEGVGKGTQSVYMKGNIREDKDGKKVGDVFNDTYTYEVSSGQVVDWTPFVDEPFFPSYATIHSAEDAYKIVLSNMGANQPMQDDHDRRNVQEALDRSYTYQGKSCQHGFINKEDEAGGFEVYPETSWAEDYDTDLDGLPNWWEEIHGTDPHSASEDFTDSNSDPDGDGYTALEEYLNFMAEPHLFIKPGEEQQIQMKDLFAGFTASPQYDFVNTNDNVQLSLSDGVLTVKTAATATGMARTTLKVTDSEGSSYERQLGVVVTGKELVVTAVNNNVFEDLSVDHYRVMTLNGVTIAEGQGNHVNIKQLSLKGVPHGIYILEAVDSQGKIHSLKIAK